MSEVEECCRKKPPLDMLWFHPDGSGRCWIEEQEPEFGQIKFVSVTDQGQFMLKLIDLFGDLVEGTLI